MAAMVRLANQATGLTDVSELRAAFEAGSRTIGLWPEAGVTACSGLAGGRPARQYTPRGGGTATLVFYHGGGFIMGSLDTHDALCRTVAARAGVRVVAVEYRLAPENPFPAAFDDAVAAFRDVQAAHGGQVAVGGGQRRRQPGGGGLPALPGPGRRRCNGCYIRWWT